MPRTCAGQLCVRPAHTHSDSAQRYVSNLPSLNLEKDQLISLINDTLTRVQICAQRQQVKALLVAATLQLGG